MKILKKLLKGLVGFIIVIVVIAYIFDYEYILRGIRITYLTGHKTAFIDDYSYFNNRTIEKGTNTHPWEFHQDYNKTALTEKLEETNRNLGTVAFMIIKNDSIWSENYYDGYGTDSKSNSFSMAKSITSAMLGKAIMEGHIKNLDQPVKDFFPEFSEGLAAKMTVGDLSSMASGLNWDEQYYSPFSITARAYYDDDLPSTILGLKVVDEPGKSFRYLSGNTQLLGMVIEKATGKKLSEYLSDSFWKPLGAENDALWQLDEKDGIEKTYCCIASNARDFARFGKLYKDFGKWNGKQLLDSAFIAKSIRPRFENDKMYGYGFWLENHLDKDIFYMRGILGQYVIVIPEDDIIIVRLGHQRGPRLSGKSHPSDFYTYVEEAYKMLENAP
ncbi:serine hydrolase [Flavobacteriaceae bacterium R38]|nr:serine hydrolase [Flavobacteriaceae bacterium R38]